MTKIYVSSTYKDLKDCREAVQQQIRRLDDSEVVGMENYVASEDPPLDKCLRDVAACDVYVGIFAWRYGYIPKAGNPQNLSITEHEYRHARANKKPCLVFLLDENASWNPQFMDALGGNGERIAKLREELQTNHVVSTFDSADKLAALVSAAIQQDQASKRKKTTGPPEPDGNVQPFFRELRNSVLVAHAPADEDLARGYAELLAAKSDQRPLLSPTVLYANDETSFAALEGRGVQCAAGIVLLTPRSISALAATGPGVGQALAVLRARMGKVAGVVCGGPTTLLPAAWGLNPVFELPAPPPGAGVPAPPSLIELGAWLEGALPPWGSRAIGLPISVLAMTADECRALTTDVAAIGARLGAHAQQQFEQLTKELDGAAIPWARRYGPRREDWQPFGPDDAPVERIIDEITGSVNQRQPSKLRNRRIKVQWYPFDGSRSGVKDTVSLRRVYRDVARAGCILVVDEMSLLHPDLNELFRGSPFANNDQVALVTLSPFDPRHRLVDDLLEAEARQKQLAGAFDRYATDYDPQCELAVSDPRRLRRWLHASLPEAVTNLREPRPDAGTMRAFFKDVLGTEPRPAGDYKWAGGAR